MTQNKFENRLLNSLMDEWKPIETPRRRHGNYVRMAVMPMAVTGVLAALLVGVQVGSNSGKAPIGVASPTNPTTVIPSDPKLIASVVNSKMHDTKDVIVHAKQTTWQGQDHTGSYSVSEIWSDTSGSRFRSTESQENSDLVALDGSSDSSQRMQIDYVARTFTSCAHNEVTSGASSGNGGWTLIGNITSDTLVGHEMIDGVDTLHLLDNEAGMNREVWVDAKSLLPVRMTAHGDWGSYVIEYDWLAKNDENLKLFTLTPPAGFKDISTDSCISNVGKDGSKIPAGVTTK